MARIETIQNKSGTTYRAHVKCNGVRETATFDTRKEAQDWASRTIAAIVEKRHIDKRKAREYTIVDLMKWHIEQFPRSSNRAKADDLCRVTSIEKYDIAKMTVDRLTREVVRNWKRQRIATISEKTKKPIKEASAKRECNLMKAAINAALNDKKIQLEENPFCCLEWKKPSKKPRIPPADKMSALDAAFKTLRNPQMRLAFDFAIFSALRLGELSVLEWSDFDFNRKIATIQRCYDEDEDGRPSSRQGTKSKRDEIKIDDIPLTSEMIRVLEKIGIKSSGKVFDQLTYVSIQSSWARIQEKVPGVRWHDLRHVAASRYAKLLNGNTYAIQQITRHASPEALRGYIHDDLDSVRLAVDAATA